MVEKSLLAKIQSTLEPLLGADRFRASVSAECDFSSGEQSEESFDPARSVMVSSQKSEDVAPGGPVRRRAGHGLQSAASPGARRRREFGRLAADRGDQLSVQPRGAPGEAAARAN